MNYVVYTHPHGFKFLEYNCAGTTSWCSIYQDVKDSDGTLGNRQFKGGEYITGGAQLRCPYPSGQCNYEMILWGQKTDGAWIALGEGTEWFVPGGVSEWWDTSWQAHLPLNTQFKTIRWELYLYESSRSLDIRYPYLRVDA